MLEELGLQARSGSVGACVWIVANDLMMTQERGSASRYCVFASKQEADESLASLSPSNVKVQVRPALIIQLAEPSPSHPLTRDQAENQ